MNDKEKFEQTARALGFIKPEELLVLIKKDFREGKKMQFINITDKYQ